MYQSLISAQWNVDRGLKRFVQDPKGLRSHMGIHNALISGSFAVQFFERVVWKDSDMDIFVEGGLEASAMECYLFNDGYDFVQEVTNEEYLKMSDVLKVPIADGIVVFP